MNGKEYVSTGEASKITGLCQQTLRKFADENKVVSYTTPSGFRKFHKPSLLQMSRKLVSAETVQDRSNEKQNFIYTRVSSRKQLDDLQRQVDFIVSRLDKDKFELIQDVGSGINFKRKGIQTILDSCLQKSIGTVIIAHKDRLCRFGYDLLESIIQKSGGKIEIIDQDIYKSAEQELSEDLLSIINIFSCRQMGRRKYKKKVKEEEE